MTDSGLFCCGICFIQFLFDVICERRVLLNAHENHRSVPILSKKHGRIGMNNRFLDLRKFISEIRDRANVNHRDTSFTSLFYHNFIIKLVGMVVKISMICLSLPTPISKRLTCRRVLTKRNSRAIFHHFACYLIQFMRFLSQNNTKNTKSERKLADENDQYSIRRFRLRGFGEYA